MIIKVNTPKTYEIRIENNLVTGRKIPEGFIITDSNIAEIYKDLLKNINPQKIFIIEPGEQGKSFENYENIIKKLSELNEDTIIAFGGGVVGDLAGFVASTFKRGINLIQIPTTLLAMVDSSIGGKNGINLGNKKNYLGTIYQPNSVLIDPPFLKTLPEKEFRNGMAEIVKYYAVFGKPKLEEKITKNTDITNIISECCEIKARVVEKDEKDKSYRHVLNFGHTVGHAIELACNLSHGEAISIGMIKELEIGVKVNLIKKEKLDEIRKILNANLLPTDLPNNLPNHNSAEKILEIMSKDKKGKFIFSFNEENYNVKIEEEIIKETLKS